MPLGDPQHAKAINRQPTLNEEFYSATLWADMASSCVAEDGCQHNKTCVYESTSVHLGSERPLPVNWAQGSQKTKASPGVPNEIHEILASLCLVPSSCLISGSSESIKSPCWPAAPIQFALLVLLRRLRQRRLLLPLRQETAQGFKRHGEPYNSSTNTTNTAHTTGTMLCNMCQSGSSRFSHHGALRTCTRSNMSPAAKKH